MIRMLVNYGHLRKDRCYRTGATGPDWIIVAGIYVPLAFVCHFQWSG